LQSGGTEKDDDSAHSLGPTHRGKGGVSGWSSVLGPCPLSFILRTVECGCPYMACQLEIKFSPFLPFSPYGTRSISTPDRSW